MIRVVVGDLAFVPADAVVRPATTLLEPTAASLMNLERIAGPGFQRAIAPNQELEIGAATVTQAGDLDAGFVIHAIVRSATEPVSSAGVRRAVQSVLERAADWQFTTLAMPPLGTGAGNLSLETAATTMCGVLREHLQERPYPADVLIVVGSEDEQAIFEALLRDR